MSWQAVNRAVRHRTGSPTRKAILLVIAEHCDSNGNGCTARYSTIAEEAECSLRMVKLVVPEMLDGGILTGRVGSLGVTMDRDVRMEAGATSAPSRGNQCTETVQPVHRERSADGATSAPSGATSAPKSATSAPPSEPVNNRSKSATTEPEAQAPPETPPKSRRDDNHIDTDPHFVAFWTTYPARKDKGHARRAWRAAIRKADPAEIIAGAARYRDDPNRDSKYTANPATWLNGERWQDESTQTNKPQPGDTINFYGVEMQASALR